MVKRYGKPLLALVATLAAACSAVAVAKRTEKADLPVDQVPKPVIAAAKKAVAGFTPIEAKKRDKKSGAVYKLDGIAGELEYEIKVDANGRVLDVEASDEMRPARIKKNGNPTIASPFRQSGVIAHAPVRESSGIIASRRHAGVFWTHNDRGNAAAVYAIAKDGKVLAEFAVQASADDWEDIAADDQGRLYIGNIGNNDAQRHSLEVHRIAEPDPKAAGAKRVIIPDKTWRLSFPAKPFDCESLFIHRAHAYVVSKQFDGGPAGLYRFGLEGPAEVVLEKVADLPVRSPVTAADLSADGSRLAVLSPAGVYLFRVDGDPRRAADAQPRLISVPRGKLEGVCFTEAGLLLTSERRQVYALAE
jgi:hypothetical protein